MGDDTVPADQPEVQARPGNALLWAIFEMREAMTDVQQGSAARPVRLKNVEGLIARPDGNNVSMDREGLNLAEAQLKFKAGVALLRQEYQRVLDAIHSDSK